MRNNKGLANHQTQRFLTYADLDILGRYFAFKKIASDLLFSFFIPIDFHQKPH